MDGGSADADVERLRNVDHLSQLARARAVDVAESGDQRRAADLEHRPLALKQRPLAAGADAVERARKDFETRVTGGGGARAPHARVQKEVDLREMHTCDLTRAHTCLCVHCGRHTAPLRSTLPWQAALGSL